MKSKSVREAAAEIMAMRHRQSETKTISTSRALEIDRINDEREMKLIELGEADSKGVNLLELPSIKYQPQSVAGARKGKRGYEANFANAFKGSGQHA